MDTNKIIDFIKNDKIIEALNFTENLVKDTEFQKTFTALKNKAPKDYLENTEEIKTLLLRFIRKTSPKWSESLEKNYKFY